MALAGTLKDFLLEDIFQLIGLGNYNGCLVIIRSNGTKGEIFFKAGFVIHAKAGADKAEHAVYTMFNWKDGDFSFEKDCEPDEVTIDMHWQGVILEAARLSDEENGRAAAGGLGGAGIEITDTVESDMNRTDETLPFDKKEGFDFGKTGAKRKEAAAPGKPASPHRGLVGNGSARGDEDMVSKLKSFDIDVGKDQAGGAEVTHLDFVVMSAGKLFKDLRERMPKHFSAFIDNVGQEIEKMKNAGELSGDMSIDKMTLELNTGAAGRDQTAVFTDVLAVFGAALKLLDLYVNKNAQISFLSGFYEEISGKARLMSQHLGYPVLSLKYVIDDHRESILTDDSVSI